ncbi:MAG: hypothetical protein FWB85_01215 [Chitinispirillia bacterium]|nr:hypothetical protein [Chitinispirillia bacterium]MCL2241279.1 hypothetical protein [Chitinispirillia bacterium]
MGGAAGGGGTGGNGVNGVNGYPGGNGFLRNCKSYNTRITLPSTLTAQITTSATAETGFMFGCESFVAGIVINSTAAAPQNRGGVLTVPQDTPAALQGVPLYGANRAAWLTALPNVTSGATRRNLRDGGASPPA